MNKPQENEILNILAESAITFGVYSPTDQFIQANSIAITLDKRPIVMLGYEGCRESQAVAEDLLQSRDFQKLVAFKFGKSLPLSLEVSIVNNAKTFSEYGNYKVYQSIVESEQGVNEDGEGEGALQAVLLPVEHNDVSFGFAMCLSNEIMKAFKPYAKDLTASISLDDSAVEANTKV